MIAVGSIARVFIPGLMLLTTGCSDPAPKASAQPTGANDSSSIEIENPGGSLLTQTAAPREAINEDAAFMHGVNILRKHPELNATGAGLAVGVWDAGPVLATHQEFRGETGSRVSIGEPLSPPHRHATHVAGTIAAKGTYLGTKGMAPSALVKSYDFCGDTAAEIRTAIEASLAGAPMILANHSWSTGELKEYGLTSRGFDQILSTYPNFAMMVAAGNCDDEVKCKNREFRSLKMPATAKNVITVGAMVDLSSGVKVKDQPQLIQITDFSRLGPTADGRIKPEVIANGLDLLSPSTTYGAAKKEQCAAGTVASHTYDECSNVTDNNKGSCITDMEGTSMATPTVSGIALLLQEIALRAKFKGALLTSDELKAVLIHTAIKPGDGPSYEMGWGAVQADLAAEFITGWSAQIAPLLPNHPVAQRQARDNGRVFSRLNVGPSGVTIRVKRRMSADASNLESVRITVAWIDPAGPKLVHNIDMALTNTANGQSVLPWRLDPKKPLAPATRAGNTIDNVERIDLATNEGGAAQWRINLQLKNAPPVGVPVALIWHGLDLVP